MRQFLAFKDNFKKTCFGKILLKLYHGLYRIILPRSPTAKNIQSDLETELLLKRVLKENSVCIDVGCHKGDILDLILKYSPKAKHYGFEPIPDLYGKLVARYSKKANIFNVALSDKKGILEFNYVVTNPAYSGFKKRRYDRENEVEATITVKTDTLDNIIPENTKIDFLKIDVEGSELLVLKGGVKTIINNKPIIIFEAGLGGTDIYGIMPEEIYSFLYDTCGLKISTMKRWLSKETPMGIDDFKKSFYNGLDFYYIAYPVDN